MARAQRGFRQEDRRRVRSKMPGLRIERELEYLVAAERGDENESVALVGADRVSGRHILLRNQFPDGRGYPVTARTMTEKEERRFKQWRAK